MVGLVGSLMFENCGGLAFSVRQSLLISENNSVTNCSSAFWLGRDSIVQSKHDTFRQVDEFLYCGSQKSSIILEQCTLIGKRLFSIGLGESITKRKPDGSWDIVLPNIEFVDSSLVLDTNTPTFRFALSYNSKWGTPNISVMDFIRTTEKTSITILADRDSVSHEEVFEGGRIIDDGKEKKEGTIFKWLYSRICRK